MKKCFLLDLGAAAAGAFVVSKKLTESQKDKIAMKVDEFMLNLRDTVIKYDKYAHDYLDENRDTINHFKQNVADKFNHVANDSAVSEAFSSLKKATSDLKDYMTENQTEPEADTQDSVMQDDIIIDGTEFEEAVENELPTQVFYPAGWREPAQSLDDNSEPQL